MSKVVCQLSNILSRPLSFNSDAVLKKVQGMIQAHELSSTINVSMTCQNRLGLFFAPRINIESNTFELSDLYLDYLWVFIYATVVAYEECILAEGVSLNGFNFDINIYQRSMNCEKTLINFRKGKGVWPSTCPEPNMKNAATPFETERIAAANEIFSQTLNIILHHELAHSMFNHKNFRGEAAECIEVEKEADNWSLEETWNDDFLSNKVKRIRYLYATIFSFSSYLMACDSPDKMIQDRHLDIDARLQHIKDFISSKMNQWVEWEYFYGLLSFIARTYIELFDSRGAAKIRPDSPMYAEDLAYFYIEQLEKMKERYSTSLI